MEPEDNVGAGVHFDKWNRPIGYIISSSPGFAQFGQGEERLINMGLARKIVKASRLGFDFAMIDYESLSEMYEKDVEKQIKHVKEVQKIDVGLHLPTKLDLCISNAFEWKEMHEILRKGAFSSKEVVGAKFFLFHTSSRIRPHVTFTVGHQEPSVQQNAYNGQNLGQWMDAVDKGDFNDPKTEKTIKLGANIMRDWFKAMFTKVLYHVMGMAGDVGVLTFLERFGSFRKGVEAASELFWKKRQEAWDIGAKQIVLNKLEKLVKETTDTIDQKKETINNVIQAGVQAGRLKTQEEINAEYRRLSQALEDDPSYIEATHLRQNTLSTIGQIRRVHNVKDLAMHGMEEAIETWINGGVPPEEKLGDLTKEYKEYQVWKDVWQHAQRIDFDSVFNFWTTKGSECEEQVAYRVIAKFMYWTKDPLWKDIVGDYDPDIIIKCADVGLPHYDRNVYEKTSIITEKPLGKEEQKEKKGKESMIQSLVKKLITAVACKYIEGHLYTGGEIWGIRGEFPEKEHLKDESVYKYTRAANIQIYIETAMPPEGQEGELRIMSAHDHVTLVKHLDGGEFTSYTMDFEHLTVNFVVVDDDIKSLKDGDGKYIRMMHINAPRPIIGAHAPLEILSHDMFIIYTWLFKLRQKGMKNAYLVWEMGSFGIQRSAIAFRKIVAELLKETDPLNLPAHFYGIDETLHAAQHNVLREHGLDPLKGLIMVPEVDHGVFSKAAHEKGKAKEWEEEKYKY